jgi:hypothetical protein
MKGYRILVLVLGVLLLLGVTAAPALACDDCCSCCDPKTPGYWKNHPGDWELCQIVIGEDTFTKDQAIAMLGQTPGDKSYTLFRAYVAAVLNVAAGCDAPCSIDRAIADAHAWLDENEVGSGVAAWSCPWQGGGECIYLTLDCWNNS